MTRAPDCHARPRRPIPERHRATLRAVAARHGVTVADALQSRRYAASYARHEFWHAVLTGDRPPSRSLAAAWFGMDHTSALHGVRSHVRKLER